MSKIIFISDRDLKTNERITLTHGIYLREAKNIVKSYFLDIKDLLPDDINSIVEDITQMSENRLRDEIEYLECQTRDDFEEAKYNAMVALLEYMECGF